MCVQQHSISGIKERNEMVTKINVPDNESVMDHYENNKKTITTPQNNITF